MKIKYVTLLWLSWICLLPLSSLAQNSDAGAWYIYFGNQKIAPRWNWWNEVQYRNFNLAGDLEQLLLRTAIGYSLKDLAHNLQLGYAFILSEPYTPGTSLKTRTIEHRLYQQFLTRQTIGRLVLQHRYRLEERFLPNRFRLRARYFLSANIPLNKPAMGKGVAYLSAYNEVFLHLDRPVFDRNRLYGGAGIGITDYLRIETGWMYQILENTYRPQWQVMLFSTFPLKK